ncbi:MAG: beta strand repeat-containing protein [Planctomycetaceae bacterium]
MNMKRARFWRNLLLFSALSTSTSLSQAQAQEGVSRVGRGASALYSEAPGAAEVYAPDGFGPLTPSPYMPLDPGYNFERPMPPALPPAYDTLRNSRRDAIGPRFDIGQFLGDRLGVADNDTNFNFLLPYLMGSEQDVLFVDVRGLATDQGRGGASAGLGYRSFDPTFNRIFGISGWVDYDRGHARSYQQAGVSFESLGSWVDLRVNGYIPFGRESNLISNSVVGDPFFGGSNLLVNQRLVSESSYRGVDAEIGGPLPVLGRYGVSGYVGGYWLDSKTDDTAAGPRVRFEANVTDNFRVNVTASDDKVFGTNAWVNLNFSLPDGRPRRWFRPTPVEDRLVGTVNRSYRVQTHTRVDLVPTPVLVAPPGFPNQPQGGATAPVTVIFVDPDRPTNGDGTFERPFNTLQGFANTANTTLVIVDGSAANRPVNGSITLFGDQKLLSTSILAAGGVQLSTNLGLITLPTLAGFGDAMPVSPIFTNPAGGTLVTLAGANTEVAGFTFDGMTANAGIPNATAISGSNLVDFNIHHNTFRNHRNAVVLNNATGVGLFQANTVTGTPGTSLDGFRLTNSGTGTLDLFVNANTVLPGSTLPRQGNIITGHDGAGVSVTARNRAEINAHIVDNTISNNGNGIVLDAAATRSTINASIANNIIDGNRGEDRNLNGILDPGEDLNGDGILNRGNGVLLMANASLLNLAQLGEDLNANGRLDLTEDTNGNGRLDLSEDLNRNGVLDVSEDVNGNGTLDPGEDTNNNGLLDIPNEDTNGNGILEATEDVNGNGILDAGEDSNSNGRLDLAEDLNGNNTIDVIVEDANGNGVLDPSEDVNGNGVLDPTEDTNGNGLLDGGYLITNNQITRNTGDGIAVFGINNATINMNLTRNLFGDPADNSMGNLGRGLSIAADSGVVNANIGFLSNEDRNFNGVLDPTEDTNNNGVLDAGEDTNFDGLLNLSEDTNNNGVLDAANPLDANNFVANREGGLFVDLSGTAVGNIVSLNNTITGIGGGALTFQITGPGNGTTNGLPFSFINSSQPGLNINSLAWNLAPASLEFNTAGLGSSPFAAANNTETSTGLTTVNGSTMTATTTFAVPDQATALNLQFNGFQPANGVLDMGEDLNNNGVLDAGEDLPEQFDFNIGTATAGAANTNLIGNQFIGSQITTTFSSGQVLSGTMQAVPGTLNASQFVVDANGNNIGNAPGVELRVSQAAVLNNPTFVGNNIQFHGGSGLTANATEDGQINNLVIRNSSIQNNGSGGFNEDLNGNRMLDAGEDINGNGLLDFGAGGIRLTTFAASTAQITGQIMNNGLSNNIGPGISVTADSGAISLSQIDNNTLDGNSNGIVLNTLNGGAINTRITNNAMDNSVGNGFVALSNSGFITLNEFSNITLNNAGENGIVLSALNGGLIDIPNTEDINGNGMLDALEDLNGNGFLDVGLGNISLSNPTANGLLVTGTNGTYNLGTISGLTINRGTRGTGGIVFDVTDSTTTARFLGNTLDGSAANLMLGPGFSLAATNGIFDVTIGGPNASDRNLIQSNRGAGIAILAQNTAVGTFRIENNLITGTIDDANVNTPFSGQGIYVGTRTVNTVTPATALFNNASILSNTIGNATTPALGNIGGGLLVEVGQNSTINGLTIDGNLVGTNGPSALIGGPVLDSFDTLQAGINFARSNGAFIDNVVISNNQIVNNGLDGIYLRAIGGNQDLLDFTIRGNTISGNDTIVTRLPATTLAASGGIHFHTEGDAVINADIQSNVIENNLRNGIRTTSFEATSADSEAMTGIWTKNTIRGNRAHGIELSAISAGQGLPALLIGMNGNDPSDGLSQGNVITDNLQGGIEINLGGNLEINNNFIARNGATPGTDVNGTGGIDINMLGGGTTGDDLSPLRVRIVNNIVQNNTGDGLEVVVSNGATQPQTANLTVLGNLFSNNTARGIDVLNQAVGTTNIRIGDGTIIGANTVSDNGQEGIYVVNTASATQSQQNFAGTLLSNGVLTVNPEMILDIQRNSVTGNNITGFPTSPTVSSVFPAGGVVLRAGTGGSVVSRISDNVFSGNIGDDLWIETFVSTVNPAGPPVPTADLSLVAMRNTGDSADVNQIFGTFYTIGNVIFPANNLRLEAGSNTNGFTIAAPFSQPPWTTVPPGIISNNIDNFLFP